MTRRGRNWRWTSPASYEDWERDDPAGQDLETVRPSRDDIERRGRALLARLDVPAA